MSTRVIVLLLIPAVSFVQKTFTRTFRTTVISVSDGDTLRVKLPDGSVERLRLESIDAPHGHTVILAALPNTTGPDPGNETVILGNQGNVDQDLTGWKLTDDDGGSYALDGLSIPARGSLTVKLDECIKPGNAEMLSRGARRVVRCLSDVTRVIWELQRGDGAGA